MGIIIIPIWRTKGLNEEMKDKGLKMKEWRNEGQKA